MKNGQVWKFAAVILASILTTFIVMWLTLGANAASQADLKSAIVELRVENACIESRFNDKLNRLADQVLATSASVNQLVGYTKAKGEKK